MTTVRELKERLEHLPDEATVHPYEDDGLGIIVRAAATEEDGSRDAIGWISTPWEEDA